ncbi:transmembrane protein 119-like [Arapaima gigas]
MKKNPSNSQELMTDSLLPAALCSTLLDCFLKHHEALLGPPLAEGSGEAEPEAPATISLTTHRPPSTPPTAGVSEAMPVEESLLSQVVGFLQENLLFTIGVPSLLVVMIFLFCCASVVGHKRKSSAYYPSSFPSQKYVDERDKVGGTRTFIEVPERPVDSSHAQPVDMAQQLQADIKNAVKNLRTPIRNPTAETEGKDISPQPTEVKWQPERQAAASEVVDSVSSENEMSKAKEQHCCPSQPQDRPQNLAEDVLLDEGNPEQDAKQNKLLSGSQDVRSALEQMQEDEVPSVPVIMTERAAF